MFSSGPKGHPPLKKKKRDLIFSHLARFCEMGQVENSSTPHSYDNNCMKYCYIYILLDIFIYQITRILYLLSLIPNTLFNSLYLLFTLFLHFLFFHFFIFTFFLFSLYFIFSSKICLSSSSYSSLIF